MAFKGGTDDIRESPAIAIIEALLNEGAEVRAYDPVAMPKTKAVLPEGDIAYASDPYEAAVGCDHAVFSLQCLWLRSEEENVNAHWLHQDVVLNLGRESKREWGFGPGVTRT